jgi:hypothetical protein
MLPISVFSFTIFDQGVSNRLLANYRKLGDYMLNFLLTSQENQYASLRQAPVDVQNIAQCLFDIIQISSL